MSRVLLVTQSARMIGEFRRPWVRALYRRYAVRHRAIVARAVARLARDADVMVLAARELVDAASLPPGVEIRYYDTASHEVNPRDAEALAARLARGWWPEREGDPALAHRGVWLPRLLGVRGGILLRLEVAEPFWVLKGAFDQIKPARVALLTGASMHERIARLLAFHDGLPVETAAPRFVSARLYALAMAALFPREERLRARAFLRHPRRAVAPAGDAPVVFATCRPRHHYVVDPLAELLREAGVPTHVVATPTEEPETVRRLEALAAAGTSWNWITDYLPADEADRLAREYRPACRTAWRRIEAAPRLAERLATDDGVSLARPARPFLRDAVLHTLPIARLHQEAAFRALDVLRPRAVVITSNRRYSERALALAARARGIPCLLFSGMLFVPRYHADVFDVSDRLLVIGSALRDGLVREGVDPALITVMGDPRSTAARQAGRARLRAEIWREFGLGEERPLIVLVSKYVSLIFSAREKEVLYRTMAAARERLGRPHVIVKAHPNEDLRLLREQARAWGWSDAIVTQEYDIQRLFGAADAAVMVTSMAGLEAMALDCPVVALQERGKDFEGGNMPSYVTSGAVLRVDADDPAALAEALARLLHDPAARAAQIERGRAFAATSAPPVDDRLVARRMLETIEAVRIGGPR